jgi:hypothetical protein
MSLWVIVLVVVYIVLQVQWSLLIESRHDVQDKD